MLWKTCTKCKTKKPLYLYHANKLGKFGLDSDCKQCHAARIREYRLRKKGTPQCDAVPAMKS